MQSLVEPTGRDLRLVVAGGCVVGAVERRSLPGEWRTNVALGALRRRVNAPPPARALALRAVAALGLDLAGVDIANDESGRGYVIEVNGAVDFNATYAGDIFASAATALLERPALSGHSQPRLPTAAPLGTPLRLRAGEAASRALADSASVEAPLPQFSDAFSARDQSEPRCP